MTVRAFVLLFFFCVPLGAATFNSYLESLIGASQGRLDGFPDKSRNLLQAFSLGTALPREILVFGKGDANSLLKYGARVQTRAGKFFTALVPLTALPALKTEPSLDFLNYTPFVKRHMDQARVTVSAHQTEAAGYRGNDVIVGIVDTGIDISHPDFTTDNGLSRILFIWDQTQSGGNRPYGFDYGREWTKNDIDTGVCTSRDAMEDGLIYHGTHVAGIAAGNGSASAGVYGGVSPQATLVVVKYAFDNLGGILDAVSYIMYKARQYNKPCVINLSLGSMSGSHTEFDDFNMAMDAVVDFYGDAGKIVVWSAGNSGDEPVHTRHLTPVGSTNSLSFFYSGGSSVFMEYWYNFSNLTIALVQPNGQTNVWFTNTSSFSSYQNSDLEMQSYANGANEKCLSLYLNSSKNGTWQIVFAHRPVPVAVDGYIVSSSSTMNQFSAPDYSGTLTGQAAQKKAISVGAMVTRTDYTNFLGVPVASGSTLADIAEFSSRGPTRDGKNRPDVAAPGAYIIAPLAYSQNFTDKVNDYYRALRGTSMAAPVVTGIIAQMLEKEPYLTAEDVRIRLTANAKTNAFKSNPGVWTNTFGYGVADLAFLLTAAPVSNRLDVSVKNNILSATGDKDNKLYVLFRSNNAQVGKTVRARVYDKNGGLVRDYGEARIDSVQVKEYVWNGQDQFGRTVQPGIYFLVVSVDASSVRHPVLVVR